MAPHNLTFTLIGACLLWVGWFGFNAGSNLEANGLTAQALLNTITATAAAALAWAAAEKVIRGHASLLGAASGAVAGLVAITPAAGSRRHDRRDRPRRGCRCGLPLGRRYAEADVQVRRLARRLRHPRRRRHRRRPRHRDRGVSGARRLRRSADYAIGGQFIKQLTAVVVAIVWSAVVSVVALLIVKAVMGLRLPEAAESDGLDISRHGERAYN